MSWFTILSLMWAAFCVIAAHSFWRKGLRIAPTVLIIGVILIVMGRILAAKGGSL